jgi:hypothetical protein
MRVVNCKVAYIRPDYANLKEWCEDPNNFYIGRKGIVFIDGERYPKKDSIFANPFKVSATNNRESVVQMYKEFILEKINNDHKVRDLLIYLRDNDMNLGCWCHPELCHGDILIEIAKSLE